MPKNIVQDIIPRGSRKSIGDISLSRDSKISKVAPSHKIKEDTVTAVVRETRYVSKEEKVVDWKEGHKSKGSRLVLWTLSIVGVVALIMLLGNLFSRTTLTVTLKSQKVTINLDLVAKAKVASGELGYIPFTLVKDKEEIVPADGERVVESRSSGHIIIYNNYSSSQQRLVKNTR